MDIYQVAGKVPLMIPLTLTDRAILGTITVRPA